MKKWCLAAIALTITALTSTFAQLPTGYGIHYSPQELAVWRTRAVSGPYKTTGDVSAYSPGDWNRIVTFANAFKADPYNAGNDNLEVRQIWTGWNVPIDANNAQVPVWQGFKMQAAAFYYLIKGDTNYGNRVKRALLLQTTIPASQVGNPAGMWDLTNTPYESGFFEANWLIRLLTSYDYTKDLFSPAEQVQMEAWFRPAANYYCARVTSGPIGQCFPQRLVDNYTVVSRDAQPGGIPSYPDPIYPKSTAARHAWSPDGYIYTHVNPDGSLGNKVSRLAMHYNNRTADKMSFVGLLGVFLNDSFYKLHARQYAKEWLKYSVYPDNTMGEYERNGDYSNPNQGFQYGAKNVAQYVLLADALARKGDFSLYQYVTSEGAHNTVGGPKSLLSMLTRFGNNFIGDNPIYYASVTADNRIDNVVEATGKMAVWDYLLAISNKYYKSDFLKNIYKRTAAGSIAYNNNFTSVGGVWVPWNGPCGEQPGFLMMAGQLEDLNVYQFPCSVPTNLVTTNITQSGVTLTWDAASLAGGYTIRYRKVGATTWTPATVTNPTLTLSGLEAATGYQVQLQTNCQAGNASTWSATYSFTTAQPLCPAPTNLTVSSVTDNSGVVSFTTVSGAVNYTIDLRVQGASSWTSSTVTAPPVDLNLNPATTYEVQVRANCSSTNASANTAIATFTTGIPACPTPGGLAAATYGTDSVKMSWTAVSLAAQYRVRFKPVSSSNWKFVVVPSGTQHSEGSLLASTRYEYQVMTDCQLGNSSSYSGSAFFTTGTPPCPTVSGVTVNNITTSSASIAYASVGTGVLGYQIRYRKVGTTAWTETNDAASPLAISGLTHSTNYEVQARALCNIDTSFYSASVNFTTATPPPCPTITAVTINSITETTALVRYTSTGTGILGYQIRYRKVGTTTWTMQPDAVSPLALSGLSGSTNYEVQARSLCSLDTSSYTASVSFTTLAPPCTTPTNFAASNVAIDGATLSWVPVAAATGYEVQYRLLPSGVFVSVNATNALTALSGLDAGSSYEVKVRSLCAGGQMSAFTSLIRFITLPPLCAVPTGLSFANVSGTAARITWNTIPGVTVYNLRYRPAGQVAWTTLDSVATPYALRTLAAATQYEVQVQAVCAANSASDFSLSASFSTTGLVCYTPYNLQANVERDDSVTLSWTGHPAALGYKLVFFDPNNTTGLRYADTVSPETTHGFILIPGQAYAVQVMTLCPYGVSYWTAPVYFTMPAGCNAAGDVRREIWGNLSWQVGQPVPNRTPDLISTLSMLEDSSSTQNGSVLARVAGYICPTATGNFTFYLSGSEMADVYLATQGDTAGRRRIAYLTRGSGFRQFNSQPSATSVQVRMIKGQKYYLETVYGSTTGRAHFSLAWKTPDNDAVRLITATRFTSTAGAATPVAIQQTFGKHGYRLYPNPATPGAPIYIDGPEGEAQVWVTDATGKPVWQGRLNLGSQAEALPQQDLRSGLYMVQVQGRDGQRQTLRMVLQ